MKRYWLDEETMGETIREHQRIFDAISDKNEELAAKEIVRHLDNSEKRFFGDLDRT